MDDNELHYLTYDEEALWQAMVLAYIEEGGDVLYPGDEKEILLRGAERIIMLAFAGIDNALRMDTLRYAVRGYLDLYGEKRNCYRIEEKPAKTTVTITTNATGEEKMLPAGTAMTQDGSLFWVLDEAIFLTGNLETFTASITAMRPGTAGNGLLAGMEMSMATQDEAINSIIVAENAAGGQNREDDEDYRERIRQYGLSAVTTGTSEQYERIAMETSGEIVSAKALHGTGLDVDIYLILAEGATASSVIAAVEEACSPKNERPLNDHVTAYEANTVEYTLEVEYSGADATNITSAVSQAVRRYQEWQDNVIGQPFNPDMLKSYLYQAGCTMVTFGESSEFDGGSTIEYTEILPNQRCKGTITTAVITA